MAGDRVPEPFVYWVGQKVHWVFSVTVYEKIQTNFLANPSKTIS